MVNKSATIKYRGAIYPEKIMHYIKAYDYSFVKTQKMGFSFSYEKTHFQFHAVDRFASFPLFYTVKNGQPYVSEKVDDLLSLLPLIKFDPIGYYGTGGRLKGERTSRTPFEGISRIPPGNYLEYREGQIKLECYWKFNDLKGHEFKGTYENACEELGYLIRQAVKRCYEFAPNAAIHLSGGLDSGTISAIICQLSSEERQAYALLSENAPLIHDSYESGFIMKYQNHFPQLKVDCYYGHKPESPTLYQEAANWYYVQKEGLQSLIANHTANIGKKYILTGLGGDELASFGNNFQNVSYSLSSDWQINIYMNWYRRYLKKWNLYKRAFLKKEDMMIDSFRSIHMSKFIGRHKDWYTKEFCENTRELFDRPPMALNYFPSSYKYRLETLSRSWFTIRSDIWNYIGSHYNVNYLHPLLDADLVEFCACMPREFFKHRNPREMIKTALKGKIPNELLQGRKRPVYNKKEYKKEIIFKQICILQSKLNKNKKTFAATVYDYHKMEKLLRYYTKLVNSIPGTHQQTLGVIDRWTKIVKLLILRNQYLNTQFTQ